MIQHPDTLSLGEIRSRLNQLIGESEASEALATPRPSSHSLLLSSLDQLLGDANAIARGLHADSRVPGVSVRGRVVSLRSFKKHHFVMLSLRMCDQLQCYVPLSVLKDSPKTLTEGCTLIASGTLEKIGDSHSAPGGVELKVEQILICGTCPAGGVTTVVPPDCSKDLLLDKRHLSLTYPRYGIYIDAMHVVGQAIREYFHSEGMIEVWPPTITETKSEGGSEVFELKYFKRKAYLTQSSQMYLEALLPGVGDCYCFLPSYRAEPSQTYRHLAEYIHVEAEIQFCDLHRLMDIIEAACRAIDKRMHDSGMVEKIKMYDRDAVIYEMGNEAFLRLTYDEYVAKIKQFGITEPDTGRFYTPDEDIPSLAEKKFIDKIQRPTFIYGIPRHLKAFYMKPMDSDDTLADCCDLLLPGIGEVFGGSVRMHDLHLLRKAHEQISGMNNAANMTDEELAEAQDVLQSLKFYEDLREFGCHYTAGFGAGLSRFLLFYGCKDIKLATSFARTINRLSP